MFSCYKSQKVRVKWNECCSSEFLMKNGVKQGGILSPLLFTMFMDELLSKLKSLSIGCNISGRFAGTVCYADDLTLLSPTLTGMQKMVDICDEFGEENDLTFNPKKSECIAFSQGVSINEALEPIYIPFIT
eukprot:GHVO01024206.1.p1 GENE.GHVO01024206.1~~GHVO01024206.1.p1  ORF type:complete len:131 (-),score=10.07 GHVO01024206.1:442-834(-)